MTTPIRFSKRGGAQVGSVLASWPFGKIEISNSSVTVRVLGKRLTLSIAEVLRVESLGHFTTNMARGAGVRIFFRGEPGEDFVEFYSTFGHGEVLNALKQAGCNVIDGAT
jgi:hypothetical protein